MTSATPALQVVGMTAGYGGPPVVSGLDLEVAHGEVVTIVGPNGAGKSTVVKAIIGELRVSAGSVRLDGEEVTNLATEQLARRGIGYVPQRRDVFAFLTVRENLEMGGYLLGKKALAERLEEVLTIFPRLQTLVRSRNAVSRLSGGEQKMVALGRALMHRPRVLILDEPTAGLAVPVARSVLREQVPALTALDIAVLLIEQRATDALEISSRGYVLVSGRVEISASAEEILQRKDIGEIFLGKISAGAA